MNYALHLAFVARAVLAVAVERRVPALRPAAWQAVGIAGLAVVDAVAHPWVRAGLAVALPGVALAGAVWALGRVVWARAIVLGYLGSGVVVAALYSPHGIGHAFYEVTLPHSRRVAAVALVAFLATYRGPRSLAQGAALVPPVGLAVGSIFGALAERGVEAIRAAWWLARVETWVSLAVSCGIILAAWGRRDRG